MRKIRSSLLPLFAAVFIAAIFASSLAAGEPAITVRGPAAEWRSGQSVPVFVDIAAVDAERVNVSLESVSSGYRFVTTHAVPLPANSSASLELPALFRSMIQVNVDGGRWLHNRMLHPIYSHPGGRRADGVRMLSVNGVMQRDIMAAAEKRDGGATGGTVAARDLPAKWQSYAGFADVLVMDAADHASLSLAQREAMARWTNWLGGRVWLVGPDTPGIAKELGAFTGGATPEADNGVTRLWTATGEIFLQPVADAGALLDAIAPSGLGDPFVQLYAGERAGGEFGAWALRDLGGTSTRLIILCLVGLGILLGPVNFWYVRRKRNAILFFITTPVIALAGAAGIFAASLAAEGMSGGYREASILMRRTDGPDALALTVRGIRSGFFTPELRYPDDALVFPLGARFAGRERTYRIDMTDGQTLAGDWLLPRFATGIVSGVPVVGRMHIERHTEGGEHFVTNGLGFTVRRVAMRMPGSGRIGWADNVPPGGTAALALENNTRRFEAMLDDMAEAWGGEFNRARIAMIAECDGLPYAEDGGLGGRKLAGKYFYCEAGLGK